MGLSLLFTNDLFAINHGINQEIVCHIEREICCMCILCGCMFCENLAEII